MEVIRTENLEKIYHETAVPVHALRGIDLAINKGEFTTIMGPSGSGKTTLLNLIGGLDYPTSGKIVIDGTDISAMSDNQRMEFRLHNIGFVFQAFNLIPVLTARENIEFILLLLKWDQKARRERVGALLEAVGLKDMADRRPAELSGGQQQRVAVARALASKPRFILADEPTANLDSISAGKLLDHMYDLNQREQVTFIFSTHDPRVIERAKRVITITDGRVESDKIT